MPDIKLSLPLKVLGIIVGAGLIIFILFLSDTTTKIDDLPGGVIGANPQNIPESKLPVCGFTGAEFVEQPCYSPPNSYYE